MSGPRFSIIPGRAVDDRRLSAGDFRLLGVLGRFLDGEGWCFPSTATLADLCGLSRSNISRALTHLAACGYVQIRPRTAKGRGKIGNEYRVLFDASADDLAAAKTGAARRCAAFSTTAPAADVLETAQRDETPLCQEEHIGAKSRCAAGADVPLTAHRHIRLNVPKEEKEEFFFLASGWAVTEGDIAIGAALGFDAAFVNAAGAQHREWWSANKPEAKRTRAGWALAFHERLRFLARDEGQQARKRLIAEAALRQATAPAAPARCADEIIAERYAEAPAWLKAAVARFAAEEPRFFQNHLAEARFVAPDLLVVPSGMDAERIGWRWAKFDAPDEARLRIETAKDLKTGRAA